MDFVQLTPKRSGCGGVKCYRLMNRIIKFSLHNEEMDSVNELMNKYFQLAQKNEVCREIAASCLEHCEQEAEGEAKAVFTLSEVLEGVQSRQ